MTRRQKDAAGPAAICPMRHRSLPPLASHLLHLHPGDTGLFAGSIVQHRYERYTIRYGAHVPNAPNPRPLPGANIWVSTQAMITHPPITRVLDPGPCRGSAPHPPGFPNPNHGWTSWMVQILAALWFARNKLAGRSLCSASLRWLLVPVLVLVHVSAPGTREPEVPLPLPFRPQQGPWTMC